MANQHSAHTTTDHDTIRKWVEQRDGRPAMVRDTEGRGPRQGMLRILFRDEEDLEEVSWDDFFETFEEANLAFLYQERTAEGEESRFFKFIERD